MSDAFSHFRSGLESPPANLGEIVPDDANDLANASRALNVTESGTVRVTTVSGTTATIYVQAGSAFPVRASRVWATDTTATGIVVMW